MRSKIAGVLASGLLAAIAGPAHSAVLFSENFDSITSNTLAITTTVASMTVTGNVDAVVPSNPYGITATSTVVDLDGTTGPGAVGKDGFALIAGQAVTLSLVAGGAQRGSLEDALYFEFFFPDITAYSDFSVSGLFSFSSASGNFGATTTVLGYVAGNTPYTFTTLTFTPLVNTTFGFRIGTTSKDNIGPLLDWVQLSVASVPEPGTLALLGLGIVGLAFTRRWKDGSAISA